MAQTPEKKIENKIRDDFETAGGYIKKFFASPHTNKGIPDLIGVLNGVYVALEVKRPVGGKPTPVQLKNLQKIANAGGIACVTNDPGIVSALIKKTTNYNPENQKITPSNKNIIINYKKIPQTGITETVAAHLWNQTTGPHSLQILKKEPSQ
jgi:hypothetical protein